MLANRVREYTATVGTGDVALMGAMAGYVRFADGFAVGESLLYVIEDGDNYEIGTGTLAASDMLARTQVAETLVAGVLVRQGAAPIALSGNATISCAATAEYLAELGEKVDLISEKTLGAGVTVEGVLMRNSDLLTSGGISLESELNIIHGALRMGGSTVIDNNRNFLGGRVFAVDGNIVSPAIASQASPGSGLYFPFLDAMSVALGGFERWQFSLNELVGINGKTIRRGIGNGELFLSGGDASNTGGNLVLYGGTHATNAGDIVVRSGSTNILVWDESAAIWNFHANNVNGVKSVVRGMDSAFLTMSGGSNTNLGANLLLYGEASNSLVFRINTNTVLGYTDSFGIWNFADKAIDHLSELHMSQGIVCNNTSTDSLVISGSDSRGTGGNAIFYGANHASKANDIELRQGTAVCMHYDCSLGLFDFQNNKLAVGGTVQFGGLPEFADNDAAGAGGLVPGDLYRTSAGVLMTKI